MLSAWASHVLLLFLQQCHEAGGHGHPIPQMSRLRPEELQLSVPKVTWPLGGTLYFAFHLLTPPLAFQAQLRPILSGSPPFLSPEALKPAPTGRQFLGPVVWKAGPSRPAALHLHRGGRCCSRRGSSWGSTYPPTCQKAVSGLSMAPAGVGGDLPGLHTVPGAVMGV